MLKVGNICLVGNYLLTFHLTSRYSGVLSIIEQGRRHMRKRRAPRILIRGQVVLYARMQRDSHTFEPQFKTIQVDLIRNKTFGSVNGFDAKQFGRPDAEVQFCPLPNLFIDQEDLELSIPFQLYTEAHEKWRAIRTTAKHVVVL